MQIGGSGILVNPLLYIYDEEPPRWRAVLRELGLDDYVPGAGGAAAAA